MVVRPTFTITYRNHNGLESYWDYTSASAGRAGTGYVNSYTGNLVWTRADMGFGGNRAPVSISHIYNSNDAGENLFGMGYGWRTNYNQRVYVWEKDTDFYIWEDEDGTDHYFEKQSDGTFKDEDGLELTLTDTGSGNEKYIIQDKNGNKTYFDTLGRLTKISNNQETVSSITVSYTAADSLRIATVTDGVGRVYHYTYNSDNLLTCLSYRGTGMTDLFAVTYGYTDGMLTAVTDQDGKTASYTYNTDYHYLTSATDIDGYKITYEYTQFAANKPSRVSRVQEFDGTASGGVLTIGYGMNETTFTDKLGNVQILQFNNWGNTKSIQDGEGRAQFAQYTTDKSDTGKGNQLSLSSKLQNTVVNIITDGSFENNSGWAPDESSPTATYGVVNDGYLGSKSFKISNCSNENFYSQYEILEPYSTYTFSGYLKTTSGGAILTIRNDFDYADAVYSDVVSTNGEWTRVQVTYANNTNASKAVCLGIIGVDNATAFLDCVQLEKAPTASRYNLIQNGDFQTSGQWTATNSATGDGRTTVTASAPMLDSNVYAIVGNPSKQKNIYQTVSVSGSAGDSFVLGGWAKGDAVPIKENRAYGLYAIFNYTDGNPSEAMMAAFNPDTNGWQYTATAIVAEKDYSSITVYACYDRGANTVYFDGIQLFKEAFGTSYTYDPETGDVISVVDLQNKTTDYEYDDNGNLTAIMEGTKAKMTYTYDNWNNVLSATTESQLTYHFTYDGFGNNLSVSVKNGDIAITSSAQYSDDGNRMISTTDAVGNTTLYSFNADTNILEWVQYPEDTAGTKTTYTYDELYRSAKTAVTTSQGQTISVEYSYSDDQLAKILTPTTEYGFSYGNFGLRTNLSIGEQSITDYEYDEYNRLIKLDYQNGGVVLYSYDSQGRISNATYEDGSSVTYLYDNTGALATTTDSATGITTTYFYDLIDRLVKYEEKGIDYYHSVTYVYDNKNNLSSLTETVNGITQVYTYTYDVDNRVTSVSVGDTIVEYTYDAFGRTSQQITKNGETVVLTEIAGFFNPTTTSTSTQISNYNGFSYSYNKNGNIISVTHGGKTTSYEYDNTNQLIRENNESLGKTWRWIYDDAGNIQSREEYEYTLLPDLSNTAHTTVEYTYDEDSDWGDLLLSYGGMEIEYDAIGNPTTYGNWEMAWQHGRQLASMTDGTTTWNYTYNSNGMRTERTDGTNTYSYVYDGSQLTAMYKGTDVLFFTYDASGIPLAVNYNGTTYYYSINIQGDITSILDSSGTAVVNYIYDAWGNIRRTVDNTNFGLATLNPLRYRGYVYDQETNLYYLQSRYYNPEVGRFINADDAAYLGVGSSIISFNLFAYCGNNPVLGYDPAGTWDWGTFFSGIDLLAVGVTAIAVAASILTCGAAAPVMVAVASVTVVAGTLTAANGVAEIVEAGTGYNVVRDTVFNGDQQAYETYRDTTRVIAEIGTEICGTYYAAKGGNVCFVAGTLVQGENTTIPIESISAGDKVWAWDEQTGTVALKEVVETYINETDELIHIFVNGEEIITTPSHPFYSPVKGWTDAVHLRAGDILVLVNGEYVVVEKVQHEILETPVTVYNFQVKDYHTYYVTESGVLVHNKCGGETSATKRGKQMHKEWDYGQNGTSFRKEVNIPGVGRADAVDFNNRIIYELKPNNTRAIRQGWKQLSKYASALEDTLDGNWIRILITYD